MPQFVNTINSRANRVTQLAPKKTFKKHEPFLISVAISTKKYTPKYEKGDLVRIAKPDEIFRKGYKQNYTDEVFRVFKVATLSPSTYNLIDANNVIIEGKFTIDLISNASIRIFTNNTKAKFRNQLPNHYS